MEVNGQLHTPAVLPSGERGHSNSSIGYLMGPIMGMNVMTKK
jgi:hypothetical protein